MLRYETRHTYCGGLLVEGFSPDDDRMVVAFHEDPQVGEEVFDVWVDTTDGCIQITVPPGTLKGVVKAYRRYVKAARKAERVGY